MNTVRSNICQDNLLQLPFAETKCTAFCYPFSRLCFTWHMSPDICTVVLISTTSFLIFSGFIMAEPKMPFQQPAKDLCHRMKLLFFPYCHLPNGINRLSLLVMGFTESAHLWVLNTPVVTQHHTYRELLSVVWPT